jgi:hypothetical protein
MGEAKLFKRYYRLTDVGRRVTARGQDSPGTMAASIMAR